MKKKIALLMATIMLFGVTVGATLAWLTADADVVTNTFTYGEITIKLDEEKVDKYGVTVNSGRTDENLYKLVPNHTYTKDPTVYVQNGSEKCWVFAEVTVTDTVKGLINDLVIHSNWRPLDGVTGVYYYYEPVDRSTAEGDEYFALEPVFSTFTVKPNVDVKTVTADDAITIDAYAVQWDSFDTALAAWNATYGAGA